MSWLNINTGFGSVRFVFVSNISISSRNHGKRNQKSESHCEYFILGSFLSERIFLFHFTISENSIYFSILHSGRKCALFKWTIWLYGFFFLRRTESNSTRNSVDLIKCDRFFSEQRFTAIQIRIEVNSQEMWWNEFEREKLVGAYRDSRYVNALERKLCR